MFSRATCYYSAMNDESLIPDAKALMDRSDILNMRLAELRRRHRALDEEIAELSRAPGPGDMFTLQRMKREKLALRDQIALAEDQLTPDIIA